ncbi:hypothetical protein A0J61_03189 [Choanephora cucurbitarum]|uniref:Carbohydrate kinase PfkB domain-containing protein n=1 Tax=Choanephora cucurbitarum TaxID=101091 RepID=A0A1C7NIB9_9FUNG|nr:hypothetical protein A0J61_03189 [Choanephora cucurbitarum]
MEILQAAPISKCHTRRMPTDRNLGIHRYTIFAKSYSYTNKEGLEKPIQCTTTVRLGPENYRELRIIKPLLTRWFYLLSLLVKFFSNSESAKDKTMRLSAADMSTLQERNLKLSCLRCASYGKSNVGYYLLVIGGIALDITATVGKTAATSILHTSTPGHVAQTLGGVGRNVAEAAWRTGAKNVKLISVVGDDLAGESVRKGMETIGMTTEHIHTLKNQPTAVYNALHSNDGQLIAAVADMNIFDSLEPSKVTSIIQSEKPDFICFDGNITSNLIESIATTCASLSIPALFEPTSVPKSLKLFQRAKTMQARSIQYTTPNQFELEAMCDQIRSDPSLKVGQVDMSLLNQLKGVPRSVETVAPYAMFLSQYIPNIFTKLGEEGCLFVSKNAVIEYFSPEFIQEHEIKSVTGAGDCFVGTLIANLQKRGNKPLSGEVLKSIIQKSQLSSIRTLKSDNAVSTQILTDLLV